MCCKACHNTRRVSSTNGEVCAIQLALHPGPLQNGTGKAAPRNGGRVVQRQGGGILGWHKGRMGRRVRPRRVAKMAEGF